MDDKNNKNTNEVKSTQPSKDPRKSKYFDLFDNPMVTAAKNSMSQEYIEKLKNLGEEFYSNIDFNTSKVYNNLPPEMVDAVLYLTEGLKSGIHPRDLEKDEQRLLAEAYGNEWYTNWNYTSDDLK